MRERDPLGALSLALLLPGLVCLRGTCAADLALADDVPPSS